MTNASAPPHVTTAQSGEKLPHVPTGRARWPLGLHVLAAGALACLTVPRMAQVGMFVDGVNYAAVARNLAIGVGSVWRPFYTETVYPVFHEQPPLGLALQAAWFRLLGDALWVERAYSLAMIVITATLIVLLWRRATGTHGFAWLPLLFWLLPGVVTWAAVNNMLENTQVVFTMLAVYAFLRGSEPRGAPWWGVAAGASVVTAALVKGPVGLFPLAAPFLFWFSAPRARGARALVSGAVMWATAGAGVLLAMALGAWPAFVAYLESSLVPAVAGPRQSGRRVSQFVRHLFTGTLVRMAAMLAVLVIVGRGTRLRVRTWNAAVPPGTAPAPISLRAWTTFFFLLGLAGSIPVLFSGRVAGHYFVAATPLYALAFAGLALPFVARLQDPAPGPTRARLVAGGLGMILLAAAVVVPVVAGPLEKRDVAWVRAFDALADVVPRGATLGTCPSLRENWGLHAYMQRLFRVSLDAVHPERHEYFWQMTVACGLPPSCRAVKTAPPFSLARCETEPVR